MGGSTHSGSERTSPGGSPPRAAPVMAELVEQAAAISLGLQQRGSFGSPRPSPQRSGFGSPGPAQQQQQEGVFGSPGAGRSSLGDGGSDLSATAAAFSSDAVGDAVLRGVPSSGALNAGQSGGACAFGFGQLDLGSSPSPMHSLDSTFSNVSGVSGLDTRADWDRHLGEHYTFCLENLVQRCITKHPHASPRCDNCAPANLAIS